MRQIPERDWKAWRKLSAEALERFCARILDEAASVRESSGSARERYHELFRLLRERDDDIATVFDDQRRSNAYFQLAAALRIGIVSREDLTVFSEETQALMDRLTAPLS
jgi:hypothetical protein